MRHQIQHTRDHSGFTIVELMIATSVFAMVLLIITYGVIHFTGSYYKGITSSNTQTAAQNAIDNIVQAIQFNTSGNTVTSTDGSEGYFCAGNKLFLYDLGQKYTGNLATSRGLYEMNRGTSCSIQTPTNGTELLGKNMRVASISVTQTNPTDPSNPDSAATPLWQIDLRIAYGDSGLLCTPDLDGNTGGCAAGSTAYNPTDTFSAAKMQCKQQIGSQFCSVVSLTAQAQQRILNSGP